MTRQQPVTDNRIVNDTDNRNHQQEVTPMDDSKRDRIEMNKRAARKQARQNDWPTEKMRVCPECGRTVVFSKNWFNDDPRQGKVACTCKEYGVPMVAPGPEAAND